MAIAGIAAFICWYGLARRHSGRLADDFTWHWLAGQALLNGQNPYEVIAVGGVYQLDAPYVYPLTTAIAALPFAATLPPALAAPAFVFVCTLLLAWAITKDGYDRLPIFLSIPFLWAVKSAQWSPLLMTAALLPAAGWLIPVKPHLGLAVLAYRPSRGMLLGSLGFFLVTLFVNPAWPVEWIQILPQRVHGIYLSPMTLAYGGPLLMLAALRWRRPEARLLLAMGLVPQNFLFYDQLLLWLIPKSRLETAGLGLLSVVAIVLAEWWSMPPQAAIEQVSSAYRPLIVALLYLPCLIMVLRRPNESVGPDGYEKESQSTNAAQNRLEQARR